LRPGADPPAGYASGFDLEAVEALSPLAGLPLIVAPITEASRLGRAAEAWSAGAPILVGVDEAGAAPPGLEGVFDVLITDAPEAPRPWVCLAGAEAKAVVAAIEETVSRQPVAASIFAQVLRLGERLSFDGALTVESLAYSTLLGGEGFRRWRRATPVRLRPSEAGPFVRLDREGDRLTITLARPGSRNALSAALRDELVEALTLALADPALAVELRGDGPAFCAGGDLDEFGSAPDVAIAHAIRTLRSPARLAARLGGRLTARLHGACVGGGIEVAAAAAHVIAAPDTVFRLPEVGMGLIPGAGGTVSLPRRIGRHRTALLGLGGLNLDVATAEDWGLADAVEGAR
jgi:hypothetical protein